MPSAMEIENDCIGEGELSKAVRLVITSSNQELDKEDGICWTNYWLGGDLEFFLPEKRLLEVSENIMLGIENKKLDDVVRILACRNNYEDEDEKKGKSWKELSRMAQDVNRKLNVSDVFMVDIQHHTFQFKIDERTESANKLIAHLEDFRMTEYNVCEADKFHMSREELEQLQIKELDPRKPFYYSSQESIAQKVFKRIRLILRRYYNRDEGKEFAGFTEFDFQIYTARSNMLQTQTEQRVCDRRSGCFSSEVYDDNRKLTKAIENHVCQYVESNDNNARFEKLKKEAECNKNKFFLIIADEAHWGITSSEIKGGANDKYINHWNDSNDNVMILLVSATPWNLLTNNSRIPEEYFAVNKSSHKIQFLDKTTERNIMREVRQKKELHIMHWTDIYDDRMHSGLIVSMRSIQKVGNDPIWLAIDESQRISVEVLCGRSRKQFNMIRWTGSKSENQCCYLLLEKNDEGVRISSMDEKFVLVALKIESSSKYEIGFLSREDYNQVDREDKNHKILFSRFELVMNYGEDVMEILPSRLQGQLQFHEKENCVFLTNRKPVEQTLYGIVYPTLTYSFIIESQQNRDEIIPGKQYLSMNFFYNSMRNKEKKNQLIREDEKFQKMVKKMELESDLCLAADYAYYILLISSMRKCRLKCESLSDFFKDPSLKDPTHYCSDYLNERRSYIKRFNKELYRSNNNCSASNAQPKKSALKPRSNKPDSEPRPIECDCFKKLCTYKENEAFLDLKTEAKKLGKRKTFKDMRCSEDLANRLIKYILHANCTTDVFAKSIEDIEKLLGNNVKLLSDKLSQSFHNFFSDKKYDILRESETFTIINDLINEAADVTGIHGKMKVVRVTEQKYGHTFYATLVAARKIGYTIPRNCLDEKNTLDNQGNSSVQTRMVIGDISYSFEVIRYFDNLSLENMKKSESVHRIWQVLQRKDCQNYGKRSHRRCPCNSYNPHADALECSNCDHEHSVVREFSDLDRLPCILIVVEKGRLGDTFPPSFNTWDLRTRAKGSAAPTMASLMQELGRMCRYQEKSDYSKLPYALVGNAISGMLVNGLIDSASFCGACLKVDQYVGAHTKKKKVVKSSDEIEIPEITYRLESISSESSFNRRNSETHRNMILLQAEPQIGKTGVFLRTISYLRDEICGKKKLEEDLDDGESSDGDDDDDELNNQNPSLYSKEDRQYPYWKTMEEGKKLATRKEKSKYSAVFGPYVYGDQSPEYVLKRKEQQNLKAKPSRTNSNCLLPRGESKYRAYSHEEHNRTGTCVDCRVSVGVKIEDIVVKGRRVKISIPQLRRFKPLLDKVKDRRLNTLAYSQNSVPVFDDAVSVCGDDSSITLETWLFNPTYGRSERATVNYRHTMVKTNKKCQYVQILVVRSDDFDAYSELWQNTHALLELPADFDDCDVDVNMGGIGYARLFVQRFAEAFELKRIFVLDDNIYQLLEITRSSQTDVNHSKKEIGYEEIPFFKALQQLESQFSCGDAPKQRFYEYQGRLGCADDRHKFTGPIDKYGVLGLLRFRPNCGRTIKRPFKKTHVCSFVLLNIDALSAHNISYKPWQVHEDLHLNNECDDDKNKLFVCKYNVFLMRKKQLKTWIPEIYEWNEDANLLDDDNTLEEAKESGQGMLRWIRSTALPQLLNHVILEGNKKWKLYDYREYSMEFQNDSVHNAALHLVLTGLSNAKLGKDHTVAFMKKNSSSVISDLMLNAVREYFRITPGIGGFNRHVLLFPADLCRELSLVNCKLFTEKLLKMVFSQDVRSMLVSSHNVQHFNIPFVALLVFGKIANPFDEEKYKNLPAEINLDLFAHHDQEPITIDSVNEEEGEVNNAGHPSPNQVVVITSESEEDDVSDLREVKKVRLSNSMEDVALLSSESEEDDVSDLREVKKVRLSNSMEDVAVLTSESEEDDVSDVAMLTDANSESDMSESLLAECKVANPYDEEKYKNLPAEINLDLFAHHDQEPIHSVNEKEGEVNNAALVHNLDWAEMVTDEELCNFYDMNKDLINQLSSNNVDIAYLEVYNSRSEKVTQLRPGYRLGMNDVVRFKSNTGYEWWHDKTTLKDIKKKFDIRRQKKN